MTSADKNKNMRTLSENFEKFSNYAIEYLHENEKFGETVFSCSCGAQIESFKQKRLSTTRDTVPLMQHKFVYVHD